VFAPVHEESGHEKAGELSSAREQVKTGLEFLKQHRWPNEVARTNTGSELSVNHTSQIGAAYMSSGHLDVLRVGRGSTAHIKATHKI